MVATFIAAIKWALKGASEYHGRANVIPLSGIKNMQMYKIVARYECSRENSR